jgi:TP901 family phage tail tape measure protein
LYFKKAMKDIELKIVLQAETKAVKQSLAELTELTKNIGKVDFSSDLKKDPLSAVRGNIEGVVASYDRMSNAAKESLENQKKALAAMLVSGQGGTKQFIEAEKELRKSAEQAGKFDAAMQKVGASLQKQSGAMGGFSDSFQKVLKFEALQNFTQQASSQMADFSKGFVALDTATQSMKTLGAEAAEMAPSLRAASIAMSKELPFGAAQFQEAMGNALASGVKGGAEGLKEFAEVSAKLAVGGAAELPDVVKGLAATLNAFGASSDQAAKYADVFFNTVNFGVTTIPELNQYLSQVTPTAAAAGIEFENVGAALALMTQKGVPTAQSATKLNALLLELQKPAKDLAPILKKAGVSLESLKKDDLPTTLAKVDAALKSTGKTATTVFSSSEAGAAFNVLMGSAGEFSKTLDDVKNTTGSTDFAYGQMAQSVEVRTKQMNAALESYKIGILDAMGSSGTAFAVFGGQLGAIAPQITAIAGAAPLLGGLATSTASGVANMAKTSGEFVKSAGGISGALKSLIAMPSPFMLWAAGAVALVAAGAALYDYLTVTNEELKEQNEEEQKLVNSKKSLNKEQQSQQRSAVASIEAYKELAGKTKRTAEEQERLKNVSSALDKQFPGLIDHTKDFAGNLSAVVTQGEKSKKALEGLQSEMKELDKQSRELARNSLRLAGNLAQEELVDVIDGTLGFGGDSDLTRRAQILSGQIWNAKTEAELRNAGNELRKAIQASTELSAKDRAKAEAEAQKFIDAQLKYLKFYEAPQKEEIKSAEDTAKKLAAVDDKKGKEKGKHVEKMSDLENQIVQLQSKITIANREGRTDDEERFKLQLDILELRKKESEELKKLKERSAVKLTIDATKESFAKQLEFAQSKLDSFDMQMKAKADITNTSDIESKLTRIRFELDTTSETDANREYRKWLVKQEEDTAKLVQDARKKSAEREREERKKEIEEQAKLEEQARKQLLQREAALIEKMRVMRNRVLAREIEERERAEQSALEREREQGEVSEELYQQSKALIAERYAKQKKAQDAIDRAEAFAASESMALQEMEIQRSVMQSRIEALRDAGDLQGAATAEEELEKINEAIKAKGDLLQRSANVLATGVQDAMSAMFAGDGEQIKESARNTLAVLAAILQKEAEAFALRLILTEGTLKSIAALPFPLNVLAVPAIKAATSSTINALVSPIVSGLLSFNTGGIVTAPTVAVVGDARVRGGVDNTEMILRSDQMSAALAEAMRMSGGVASGEMRGLREDLRSMELRVRGSDLVLAMSRERAARTAFER